MGVYGVEVSGLMFKKIKDAESEKECEQKQVQHFWQNLTKLGHGELFEQPWSVASQDSDFAQTAKLFDLFCLAHAGKEQLEKHIKYRGRRGRAWGRGFPEEAQVGEETQANRD